MTYEEIKQRCELEIHTYPWRTVDAMRLLEDRDTLLKALELSCKSHREAIISHCIHCGEKHDEALQVICKPEYWLEQAKKPVVTLAKTI